MRKLNGHITEAVIFRTAELFLEQNWKVQYIINQLNQEFPAANLKRQSVYLLLSKAKQKGMLRPVAQPEIALQNRIQTTLKIRAHDAQNVTVVDCPPPQNHETV